MDNIINDKLIKYSVLRIGEVCEIEGKRIYISLDKEKNASDLYYNGTVLKNVSVGSFIEIKKGFLSIICKIDGESLIDENVNRKYKNKKYINIDRNKRILSTSVSGFIEDNNKFFGGIKGLPLIGNEAFILTEKKINLIHKLLKNDNEMKIKIEITDKEEIPIEFPIDGLFNSHIAIFGNTGSGKSNTLASLYSNFISELDKNELSKKKCRFFFFDFNGEYVREKCISNNRQIYNLSTNKKGDKLPIEFDELINIENLSILFEATEKTQRPFLNRALKYFQKVKNKDNNIDYYDFFINILAKKTKETLLMANKDMAYRILDYIEEILSYFYDITGINLREDIEFQSASNTFLMKEGEKKIYFDSNPDASENTIIYRYIKGITEDNLNKISELNQYFIFILLQLINDLTNYKIQIDHILPVINRFKSKRQDIEKIFIIKNKANIWGDKNVVIMNLHNVNIDMRKTIPLLIAKYIYNEHKKKNNTESLSIIIDEAHNILSKTSFRETEDWKDYRLETFEEIIKEGRKFGVFVTISSQRPNDISETIISQAHNYFIHQLINQNDLKTIGNAVSYIDKITEESIPTLPVGTCIFSGIATPMPLKIKINELAEELKPQSHTLKFSDIIKEEIEF